MSIPYYIVLAITTALVLTHLRMKTVGHAYREGFERGFDRGRDEANRLHNTLPPVPMARNPLLCGPKMNAPRSREGAKN